MRRYRKRKHAVFRECERRDGARVPREVGHVLPILYVPDLDHRVLSARPEYQSVRVELHAREAGRVLLRLLPSRTGHTHFAQQLPGSDVEQRPVLFNFILNL